MSKSFKPFIPRSVRLLLCVALLTALVPLAHPTGLARAAQASGAGLAERVQTATGDSVEVASVDQRYTGDQPAADAQAHGIRLEVVKLPTAKHGFVLLPRRGVNGAREPSLGAQSRPATAGRT